MAKKSNEPPRHDPRGHHARVYRDLLNSPAWKCLEASDKLAYIALAAQKGRTNNGDLSLPLTKAREHGIKSAATLAKSLRALTAVGLVAISRRGGTTRGGQCLPNLYRMTEYEAYANPNKYIEASAETHEWRKVASVEAGRDAIRAFEASAKISAIAKQGDMTNRGPKKKNLVQSFPLLVHSLNRSDTETSSTDELRGVSAVQNLNSAKCVEKRGSPITAGGAS